jgi:LysR substrate binding domain
LGVLLDSDLAARLAGPNGVALHDLGDLQWVGFPRTGSPAWYDELTGILRSHGLDIGNPALDDQELIAVVKFTAVSGGQAFALWPEHGLQPLPDNVSWSPLIGQPLVRRTWVVWPANSRRRDIGHLVAAFELPEAT